MAEEKINAGAPAADGAPKKSRRGVNNQTQAVSQLRFHEKDAAPNGLFIGHLEDARVDWSVNADGGSFTGLRVPRVTLSFVSEHKNVNEQRHVYQTIFPQPSNVDTIPGGKDEWRVNNVFKWIRHILDIYYLKGRDLTQKEVDALELGFCDYEENEDGSYSYVPVDVENEVLPAYRTMFENFVAMMNGSFNLAEGETPKPCYKTADGKTIPCWLKLLRHKKAKGKWTNVGQNGELAFDSFIGNGCIEILKKDLPPAILRLNLATESITPKDVNKQPTIGGQTMPGMGGVAIDGGMPMGNMPGMGAAGIQPGEGDMPF